MSYVMLCKSEKSSTVRWSLLKVFSKLTNHLGFAKYIMLRHAQPLHPKSSQSIVDVTSMISPHAAAWTEDLDTTIEKNQYVETLQKFRSEEHTSELQSPC